MDRDLIIQNYSRKLLGTQEVIFQKRNQQRKFRMILEVKGGRRLYGRGDEKEKGCENQVWGEPISGMGWGCARDLGWGRIQGIYGGDSSLP